MDLRVPNEIVAEGQLVTLNYEHMPHVLLKLAREAGVRILFFSLLADSIVDNGMIRSIIVQTQVNRFAIKAKIFVDCTGLATLAHMAGAPTFRESSSMGLASVIEGVNVRKFQEYLKSRPKVRTKI